MNKYHVIIPAAGHGSRFRGGSGRFKQYADLGGVPVIKRSVDIFAGQANIEFVYVVVSPEDQYIESLGLEINGGKVRVLKVGGVTRAETVRNALIKIEKHVDPKDWVLVHDAARPLITVELIQKLINSLQNEEVGGLLAIPVSDTLKLASPENYVSNTVSRERLWAAQTPQMFRFELLLRALNTCDLNGITDESGAIEAIGLSSRLVESSPDNIKITFSGDISRAELILQGRLA